MLESAGIHGLALFATAALLLNVTPGPDMLFVLGTAAARGRRAGILAALGVGAGCLLHVCLAAFGIGALLAASPRAFEVLRWAGAGYLVWSGVALLRASKLAVEGPSASASGRTAFWQGVLTNALNPKVVLFFLAFLPQFISDGAARPWLGLLLLGLWFTIGGTLVTVGVAVAAGTAGARLLPATDAGRWLRRVCGAVFVALGIRLVW